MEIQSYNFKKDGIRASYQFISIGPKGRIIKRVLFYLVYANMNVYNLAFGDIKPNALDEIDDLVVSNNGDTDKVLKTIVLIIKHFLENNPKAFIFFKGNTKSRTRLYRMRLRKYYPEISQYVEVFGIVNDELFKLDESVYLDFDSFLIKYRKES